MSEKSFGCSQASATASASVGDALAAAREAVVHLGAVRARLEREPLDELDLLVGVARPAVHGHHAGQPERS